MKTIEEIKPQIGMSIGADFEENTWTFKMPSDFKMKAGRFVITPYETKLITEQQLIALGKELLKKQEEMLLYNSFRSSAVPVSEIIKAFDSVGVKIDDKIDF